MMEMRLAGTVHCTQGRIFLVETGILDLPQCYIICLVSKYSGTYWPNIRHNIVLLYKYVLCIQHR